MSGQNKHIELTGKGFRLLNNGRTEAEFEWIHITEIVAYRRDPEGVDLLCLGFRASAAKDYVEVDEETDGYSQLLPALYDTFSTINPDWWQDVAGPLGTNRQTIYGMTMSEEDEPAADKYLKSLSLQKKESRRSLKLFTIMLGVAVVAGLICGTLSIKSSIGGKWGFILVGGMVQAMAALAVLRKIRPVLLSLAVYALVCWMITFLCR